DILAYRNDAAIVFRRQIRGIPTVSGLLGVVSCDKGTPAMLMALAAFGHLPSVVMLGGSTLPATVGEDNGKTIPLGAKYVQGEISLEEASVSACRACASAGGGCQFLGTASTGQVLSETMGLALPHSALAPSGQPIWLDIARRSAKALVALQSRGITLGNILTDAAIRNAMVMHAALGGSTNWLIHLPAVAHAAGLRRPTIDDWNEVNRRVPRLVSVTPNGPVNHPTVRVFMAGGVPEIMLRLRDLDLFELDAMTVAGRTWGEVLAWWEGSPRREALRKQLRDRDGIDPDEVIMTPARAKQLGVSGTTCFPRGNLAPQASAVKSTAIDPRVIDADGVYRKTGPAKVFVRETDAIASIKGQGDRPLQPGDVMVLICRGSMGSGLEEVYEVTAALRYLSWGHEVALVTDARFSGVSTGACIGLVVPEALAGGPLGKVRDGDRIQVVIDCNKLEGSVDFIGEGEREFTPEEGAEILAQRPPHPHLSPDPQLPDDTRLWAALQQVSGGTWGGCVYDVEKILAVLKTHVETIVDRS
ncbi:MAG: YjhG/YagF family D-xylonate dehydratase, partial [Planctomycetota bacterium]|nr:YjhG/YagF family D-xylonate dehydratase [Planctomycetota bacterium]